VLFGKVVDSQETIAEGEGEKETIAEGDGEKETVQRN